ncbi:hypothetical protein ABU614_04210 [Lysobacter firmicutimachus]|uniref:Metalloenzyme domain-containing protein n=1 Tax=Lysobacter firmicutimachus TaxID=1792846 RepID=A0AAU8MWK6_9GAMM
MPAPSRARPTRTAALLAERGLTQLRIAETEKYAHVTFFFSGGREEPYAGGVASVPLPDFPPRSLPAEQPGIDRATPAATARQIDAAGETQPEGRPHRRSRRR